MVIFRGDFMEQRSLKFKTYCVRSVLLAAGKRIFFFVAPRPLNKGNWMGIN